MPQLRLNAEKDSSLIEMLFKWLLKVAKIESQMQVNRTTVVCNFLFTQVVFVTKSKDFRKLCLDYKLL